MLTRALFRYLVMKKLIIVLLAIGLLGCKKEEIEPIKIKKPDGIMIPIEWYVNRDKPDTVIFLSNSIQNSAHK